MLGEDAARRLDAIEDRHVEIHEHDIRGQQAALLEGLGAVGRHAHELDLLERGDEPSEPVADDAMVVRQDHADHRAGTSSATVVPFPGLE